MIASIGFAGASATALAETLFFNSGPCTPAPEAPADAPVEAPVETGPNGTDMAPGNTEKIDFKNLWDRAKVKPSSYIPGIGAIYNFIFPVAQAKINAMPLVGAVAGLGLGRMVGRFIEPALNNGYARAAIFGAFGAMGMVASSMAKKGAKTLKDRATHYHNLAQAMDERLKETEEGEGGEEEADPENNDDDEEGEDRGVELTDRTVSTTTNTRRSETENSACFVGVPGQQFPSLDPSCQCRKRNKCLKAKIPLADFKNVDPSINDSLNSASGILRTEANNLYSGKNSAGTVSDKALAQMASRMKRIKKKMGKLLRNKLKNKYKRISSL